MTEAETGNMKSKGDILNLNTPKRNVTKPTSRSASTPRRPPLTFAGINEKLAATRTQRLAKAEANCVKITGKNRL